jgi:hypothetical protein
MTKQPAKVKENTEMTNDEDRIFYKGVETSLVGTYYGRTPYLPGKVKRARRLDTGMHNCGEGINACRTIDDALSWGNVIVKLRRRSKKLVEPPQSRAKVRFLAAEVLDVVGIGTGIGNEVLDYRLTAVNETLSSNGSTVQYRFVGDAKVREKVRDRPNNDYLYRAVERVPEGVTGDE